MVLKIKKLYTESTVYTVLIVAVYGRKSIFLARLNRTAAAAAAIMAISLTCTEFCRRRRSQFVVAEDHNIPESKWSLLGPYDGTVTCD